MKKLKEKSGITLDRHINLGTLLTAIIGIFAIIISLAIYFFGEQEQAISPPNPSVQGQMDQEQTPPKAEIFSSTLNSLPSVKNDGGIPQFIGPKNFEEGHCGVGFISRKNREAIEFPTKDLYLKGGTVSLCVTLDKDLRAAKDELFLFVTYKREYDAIALQLINIDTPGELHYTARMRIKRRQEGSDSWIDAETEELDWKKGEHYHLAGTWGEEGVMLYIDGQRVAHNRNAPARPTLQAEVFTLNNDTAVDHAKNPTHCILRNLRIFNYPLSDAEVIEIYREIHPDVLE